MAYEELENAVDQLIKTTKQDIEIGSNCSTFMRIDPVDRPKLDDKTFEALMDHRLVVVGVCGEDSDSGGVYVALAEEVQKEIETGCKYCGETETEEKTVFQPVKRLGVLT